MKPTPREIERWVPRHFGEVVGCRDVKEHFVVCLKLNGDGVNTFVSGKTGSGKTACCKAYIRSLMCPHRDADTQRPCLQCDSCRTFDVRYSEEGLYSELRQNPAPGKLPINFYPVNCGKVTEVELREILNAKERFAGRFIIFLDEVHRLIKRKMQHMLLVPIQEDDAVWIAATAEPDELDPMFRRRFSARLVSEPPSRQELIEFIRQRCDEWEIAYEPNVIELLARKCDTQISDVLGMLAVAAGKPSRELTREQVTKHFN